MAKRKGNYMAGPGRNPLYNELMKRWGVYLPESYYAYIKEQSAKSGVSMNAYLIALIDKDKKENDQIPTP